MLLQNFCVDVMAEETDDKMIEFAMGGLCNCCLGISVDIFACTL